MIKQFMSRQFLAFLLTGGAAAVVNFGSRVLYSQCFSFSTAVILAYVTGMVTAFYLAKTFVFKSSRQAMHRSAGLFVLVNIFAAFQTWGISMGMAYLVLPRLDIVSFSHEIAHAVGVAAPVFTSYIGHKHLSFRS
jgi:putative flippase GtrA